MIEHRTFGTGLRALLAAALVGSPFAARAVQTAVPAVTWTENLNGALVRAGNELKPVFLLFYGPNCPYCVRLKTETLSEKEVLTALEGFICVSIDTSRDPETARRYGVAGVPLSIILSGDGRIQSYVQGFVDKTRFLGFLDEYHRGGGKRDAAPAELPNWLKALQSGKMPSEQWPRLAAALGIKACRVKLHDAMLACNPCPRREWVALLQHPKLAVRLGAFELLEEIAGSGYGYDPWQESASNRQALERWQNWAACESNEVQQVFAALTDEQTEGYVRDLASGDRDRAARAVRMLEQAGEATIPALEAWMAKAGSVSEDARRRVREVRYFLLLPDTLGTERARISHRLVFGNQDERVRSLAAAASVGGRALPVLADFLSDADSLIREAAVDNLVAAGKNDAFPYLAELLKTEKDEEVIHTVVRSAGSLKGPKAVELVGRFLTHANEDLVVAALSSLGRTKSVTAANAVKECLKNPRWRVRAAALEAIGTLRASMVEDAVAACLDDSDAFVRRSAVMTLASLSAKKSAAKLGELFLKDDALKGPIIAALRAMDKPLPPTFGPALKGKDPEVLLSVMEGVGDGDGEFWRLALPYVTHANTDVACAAIRVVARGGAQSSEARNALARVLRDGDKNRVRTVFESYKSGEESRSRYSFDSTDTEDFDALVEPSVPAGSAGATGVVADALSDLFAAFSGGSVVTSAPATRGNTSPVPAAAGAPAEGVNLQDLFSAFGPAEGTPAATTPSTGSDESTGNGAAPAEAEKIPKADTDWVKAAEAYLGPERDADLRFAAALMLMGMGKGTGVAYLAQSLDSRTADERLAIAKRAEQCGGSMVLPLLKRLLRDASADVRQAAVAACLDSRAGETLTKELLTAAAEPDAILRPADLFKESYEWFSAVRRPTVRRQIGVAVRQILSATADKRYSDPQRILALTLLDTCWKEGDQALVAGYLGDANPFVRRAAWYALGRHQASEFLEKHTTVARDTSEWVRAVVPAVYTPEIARNWAIYFDAETAVEGMSSFSSSSAQKKLPKPVVATLIAMSGDSAVAVRTAAALCLFANREKADLRALASMLESEGAQRMLAYRVMSVVQQMPVSWLREQDAGEVLALLDVVAARTGDDDESRLNGLRKQLVSGTGSAVKPKVVARKADGTLAPAGSSVAGQGGSEGSQAAMRAMPDDGAPRRLVLFFRNPGCPDCARVADLLRALKSEFTDMVVEEANIRKPDDARLNEVLCERFEVPDKYRLIAPAIFCGAGYLAKSEITFESLGRLVGRAEAVATAWRQVNESELARADATLGEVYAAMGFWIVLGAGLLDGINPCAFATIIFLLSYLQMTRRGPREILAVGAAFVAGVFIAYYLLGLGLVEVVVRWALLRRMGQALNWGMAAFVAVVAVLSVWDGIQCLRGRMGDMVLQLPGVLKDRIHEAVRRSTRHRNFVIAAFVAGLVIAVLELACTGQVYLPTLLYMIKTGQGRAGAAGYLALYNVAFVVPLLIVFAGAYGGLRSERVTQWLRQRAAIVKFATAILFAALFVLFVLGGRVG